MGDEDRPGGSNDWLDRYPLDLAGDVETMTGDIVHLRPIRPDDGDGLTQFHEGLSAQSVYRRFFFTHPRLSAAETDRFTHVDYLDRLALVAEHHDRLVAVGRYERIPGTAEAEVAFVVADEFQHQGIGTILLERLAGAAWQNGIEAFSAQTLSENRDMLEVFMKSGFHVTTGTEYGTVSVRFPIRPDDAYRSAYAGRHHGTPPGRGGASSCSS
ncbi:MAG: GNAT family N-acetyltransferase [Acidimicrobiales bacterium]